MSGYHSFLGPTNPGPLLRRLTDVREPLELVIQTVTVVGATTILDLVTVTVGTRFIAMCLVPGRFITTLWWCDRFFKKLR